MPRPRASRCRGESPLAVANSADEPIDGAAGLESADASVDVISPIGQKWVAFGNDPEDAAGIRSVLLAVHSKGKPEMMSATSSSIRLFY